MPAPAWRALTLALALACTPAMALDRGIASTPLTVPLSGVIGMQDAYFAPEFWIARTQAPDQVLMTPAAIQARNVRLLQLDDSMHDLAALPVTLDRARVAGWIDGLASPPSKPLWDEAGKPVAKAILDAIVASRAMDTIPASQPTRFGIAVQRTALRAFPTDLRVFNRQGETDIDRFQESALFPGDPVAIVHASRDAKWLFVISARYAAWVAADAIAEGDRASALGYATRAPHRIVTGAKPRTVFTREEPRLSELQLDMGVRIPLASVPQDKPVNGQHPYASWILELPVRGADGRLGFAPALLQRNADTSADYLPLTRANLIRQSFKFLGERYGWGHSYNGRDCSGFVSEVYRSMGVELPRNTSDQSVSPAFDRIHFEADATRAARMAAVDALDVGDLIYIPGHVMMFAGRIDGMPWVIHDTNGGSFLGADGTLRAMQLNGVSLTPLVPLRFGKDHDYIDRITNIVRMTRDP
ncbi:SH3 domain-containing protein [Thermomonas carbonis]|uniref:SH3 domain-containing protein n=2 Tax=Thermomonas carbonis TaxID=1463158 RepID=A0A7G9SUW6_9GAMM|nr:SH3 domain-containing protein [Thermomonas carbonis]